MAEASKDATHKEPPKGFPKSIIVGDPDIKYLCPICTDVLRKPCQGTCGHRFCKECVEYQQKQNENGKKVQCPGCLLDQKDGLIAAHEVQNITKTYPDNAIIRELSLLQVICLIVGCAWKGPLKRYESHIKTCQVKTIGCVICGSQFLKDKEFDHELFECLKRRVPCPMCKDPIPADDLENHNLTCSKAVSTGESINIDRSLGTYCPFGCSTTFTSTEGYIKHCKENTVTHIASLRRDVLQQRDVPLESGSNQNRSQTGVSSESQVTPALEPLEVRTSTLEEKYAHFENLGSVLVREIEKETQKNDMLERQRKLDRELLDAVERKLKSLERTVALKDITIAEMDLRIQVLEQTSYDGSLTWRIPNFSRKRQEAISGRTTSIYSPVFFTSKKGYKMCGRIYLNGDGMGKGTHVSLFFVVMRGSYDALLSWPFRQKVTFRMLDQNKREDIVDTFRPDPTSSSFRRPTSEMNIASGCPMFMAVGLFDNPQYAYVKDDIAFVEIEIETSI